MRRTLKQTSILLFDSSREPYILKITVLDIFGPPNWMIITQCYQFSILVTFTKTGMNPLYHYIFILLRTKDEKFFTSQLAHTHTHTRRCTKRKSTNMLDFEKLLRGFLETETPFLIVINGTSLNLILKNFVINN